MSDEKLTIYHNPRCSKSREALQILQDNQKSPDIVEYLNETLTRQELRNIINMLGVSARDLLRTGEDAYKEANLDDPSLSDDDILAAICEYPILLQRPIVISGTKAIIGRPPSNVLDIIKPDAWLASIYPGRHRRNLLDRKQPTHQLH